VTTKNKNIISHTKELSILITQYGLSFMIEDQINHDKKFFEYIFDTVQSDKITEKLAHIIAERPILNELFKTVNIIHHNRLNSIIPVDFFDPGQAIHLLKSNIDLSPNDSVAFDSINNIDAVNIYVPFKNITKYFSAKTKELKTQHSATFFFNNHNKIKKNYKKLLINEIFINIFPEDFQIAVYKNEKLVLYNHFAYENEDEFLYYLFFVTETLGIDEKNTRFFISGIDSSHSIIKNLKQFTENFNLTLEKKPSKINNYI